MKPRARLGCMALLLASACTVAPPGPKPIAPVQGSVPVRSETPMSDSLACVRANMPPGQDLRVAVHSIPDKTGVTDYDGPGHYVTQGAELMMISALSKAGIRQVNRTATNIAEWELKQAMDKRLGEGAKVQVGDQTVPFRPVPIGAYLGSTHTLYGGITELDFDMESDGAELHVAGIGGKARGYYIGIALDIVVADTRTTEIVIARSWRKQVWGQELEGNLFRFWDLGTSDGVSGFGKELFDVRLGRQRNEPIHQSVRWAIEQAAYEIARDLGNVGAACDDGVPEFSRTAPEQIRGGVRTVMVRRPVAPSEPSTPLGQGAPVGGTPLPPKPPVTPIEPSTVVGGGAPVGGAAVPARVAAPSDPSALIGRGAPVGSKPPRPRQTTPSEPSTEIGRVAPVGGTPAPSMATTTTGGDAAPIGGGAPLGGTPVPPVVATTSGDEPGPSGRDAPVGQTAEPSPTVAAPSETASEIGREAPVGGTARPTADAPSQAATPTVAAGGEPIVTAANATQEFSGDVAGTDTSALSGQPTSAPAVIRLPDGQVLREE